MQWVFIAYLWPSPADSSSDESSEAETNSKAEDRQPNNELKERNKRPVDLRGPAEPCDDSLSVSI